MKLYPLFVFALFLTLFSCDNVDLSAGDLEISVTDNSLILENNSNESLYYFAVDRNALALISWAPMIDEEFEIKSGDSVELLFDDITGSSDDTAEIVVHYWGAVKENGEKVAGEIFQQVVTIN